MLSLESKIVLYETSMKSLKNERVKIRTYMKDMLLRMMMKDLSCFITPKRPLNLSIPLIVSVLIKIGETVYDHHFPDYLDSHSKNCIL